MRSSLPAGLLAQLAAVASCLVVFGGIASAGTPYVWSGSADGSWSNDANWVGGSPAFATGPTTYDSVLFNSSSAAPLATTMDIAGLKLGQLIIGDAGGNPGGAVSIAIGGTANTLTLMSGIDMSQATQNLTISANTGNSLVIGAAQNWTVAGGQVLTVSAPVAINFGLTLNGPGTVTLSGANTGSGGVTLSAGTTLNVNNAAALGTGTFTVTGGTLNNTSGATVTVTNPLTIGGNFAFTGTNNLTQSTGAIDLGTASRTVTVSGGTLTLNGVIGGTGGALVKDGAGTLALGGANTFNGGLTVGGGTVLATTSGNLGATGITLNGGTLALNQSAQVTMGAAQVITFGAAGGAIDTRAAQKTLINTAGGLTGSGTFTHNATANGGSLSNILQISVPNTGFTGAVVLNGGVTEVSPNGLGTGAAAGNTITVNPGAEMVASSGTIANPLVVNGGTFGGDNATSTYSGLVTVNGSATVRLGNFWNTTNQNLNITGALTTGGTGSAANVLTTANSNAGTASGQILTLNPAAGTNAGFIGTLSVSPGHNVVLGSANAQVGGTLKVNSDGSRLGGIGVNYDFGGAVPAFTNVKTTTGGVFGVNTALAGTTTLNLATLGGGGMFLGSQGTGSYTAATLGADGTTYRLGGGGGTLTIANGALADNGSATAVVVGDTRTNGGGTVVLGGANTYTGTTTVSAGTLSVTNGGALGSPAAGTTVAAGAALSLTGGITVAEPLTITAVASTAALPNGLVSASGNNTFAGNITANNDATNNVRVSAAAGTLTLTGNVTTANAATSLVFAGAGNIASTGTISGPAGFISTNTGTVTLSDANTYTGKTQVQSGKLVVTSFNSVNGGTPLLAGSSLGRPTTAALGTIDLGNTSAATLVYTGAGETTDRVLNLAGATSGVVLDQSGTGLLKFTSNLTDPGTSATSDQRKTLTLQGSTAGAGEIAGVIRDSVQGTAGQTATSVTKLGTGTWTLGGANTYTGATTVSAGTLNLTGSLAGSAVTVNGATAAFAEDATGSIGGTGGFTLTRGTATLAGTNTYTGTTTVNTGTLTVTGTLGATALAMAGPGTFNYQAPAAGGTLPSLGALSFTGAATGEATVQSTYGTSGTAGLTFTAYTGTRPVGVTGNLVTSGGGASNAITVTGASGFLDNGIYYNGGTGSGAFAYAGSGGVVRGIAYGTDAGTATSAGGTTLASQTHQEITGAVTAQTAATFQTLRVSGASNLTLASGVKVNVNSILKAGGGTAIIASDTGLTNGTAGGEYLLRADGPTDVLTINSPLLANGVNAVTVSGAGKVVLGSAGNTFTGNIYVNGGATLEASMTRNTAASALGGQIGATFRQFTLNNGTFRQTAGQWNDDVPSATNVGVAFVIGPMGGTFDVPTGSVGTPGMILDDGSGAGVGSTNAQLQGSGNLTKTGAGVLSLGNGSSNFSAFTGRISLNQGTVILGSGTFQLGDAVGDTTVAAGAVLDGRGNSSGEPLVLNGTGISGGGALVNSNTGTSTFSGPITLATGASVGGAAGVTLSGGVGGPGGLTKVGAGLLTLSGTNTYAGGTTVSAGVLQLNTVNALPAAGTALIGTTLAVNNFGSADVATTLAKVDPASAGTFALVGATSAAADVNFTGLPALSLGTTTTGGVTYTGTFTPAGTTYRLGGGGGTLTFGQAIPSGGVVVGGVGGGTVVLTGANTYAGGTTVTNGNVVSISSDANLGGAATPITFNGGGLQVTGTAVTGFGTRAVTFTPNTALSLDVAAAGNTFTLDRPVAMGTGVFTKAGAGTLTVTAPLTTAANVVVSGGTLNLPTTVTGSTTATTLAYGGSANTTTVVTVADPASNLTLFATTGANATGSVAVYNQSAGSVAVTGTSGADTQYVAKTGYGYFNLTGGTYRVTNRFEVTTTGGTSPVGVGYVGGTGTLNNNNGDWTIIAYSGTGQLTVAPGGSLTRVGATSPLGIALNSGSTGVLNVAGGWVDAGTQTIRVANSTTAATTGITGFVNVAGGTLSVGTVGSYSTAAGSSGNLYYAFAGGTLRATAALASGFAPASVNGVTTTTTVYGAIDNAAATGDSSQNFAGGMVVDTNGFAVTFPNVLNGAAGTLGVAQSSLTVTGGTGYVGAPAVQFTGGTVAPGGTPAAGYALISNGAVTGIVITNPGSYSAAPTAVALTGGGGSGAAVALSGPLVANTAGGLTKIGTGTLTLSNANTYTGPTAVTGGGLTIDFTQVGSNQTPTFANYVSSSSALTLGGATLTVLGRGSGAATSNNSWTGTTSSPVLTFTTLPGGVVVGQSVTGSNIPAGAYVVAINTTGKTLTLNANPTGTTGTDLATVPTPVATSQAFPGLTLTPGASAVVASANGGGGTLIALGPVTRPAGAALDFTLPAGTPSATNGITTVTANAAYNVGSAPILGGYATVGGANWAVSAGDGTTAGNVTALSSYTTGFTANTNVDATTGTSTPGAGGLTVNSVRFNTAGAYTVNTAGPITVATGGILETSTVGNNAVAINGNTLTSGNGTDLVVHQFNTANAMTIGSAVTGSIGLTKAGAGTVILTGANDYTGTTTVAAGTLQVGAAGTTGTISGNVLDNGTLAFSRSDAYGFAGNITGTGGVTKLAAGTTTLGGTLSYAGTTTVDNGKLVVSADQALAGGLTFGANGTTPSNNTTASTLDLGTASASFGGLGLVRTKGVTNTITVGAGKTLALNGGLTLGYDAGAGTGANASNLTVTGAGALSVTGAAVNISVNQAAQNAAYYSTGTLDVAGLANFSANVTTFNIGVGSTTTGFGTVNLSNTANTVQAATLTVGDSGANNGNGTSTLVLGTGTNVLNVDTLNIGRGKGTSPGVVKFASQAANGPGAVVITNRAGTGGAAINIGDDNGTSTAGAAVGTLDLRGHLSTVTASTLTMARLNMTPANTGGTTATLFFDTGTFTVDALNMAPKTQVGTGTATATLNVGGGAFTVNSGGSFTLGSQATAGASVATLNLTGGVFTANANILDGGGATTSTVTVNGGALDLTGHAIGSATVSVDNVNLQAGTLRNVGEVNNGAAVVKTTAGALTLDGSNTFTGGVNFNAGTLNLNSPTAPGTGLLAIAAGTILDNTAAAAVTLANNNAQAWNGDFTFTGTRDLDLGTGTVTLNASRQVTTTAGTLTVGGVIGGTGFGLTKAGAGTLTLTGANTYTGGTTVTGGTLRVNNTAGSGTGPGAVAVNAGGTLAGTGAVAGDVGAAAGGTVAPGNAAGTGVGVLTAGGNVTFAANANLAVELGGGGAATSLNLTNPSATVTFTTGSVLALTAPGVGQAGKFDPAVNGFWTVLTLPTGSGGNLQTSDGTTATTVPDLTSFGHLVYSSSQPTATGSGPVGIDVTSFASSLTDGAVFDLYRNGDTAVLAYTSPVPEPATVGLVAAAGLGLGGLFRRRLRRAGR